MTATEAGKASPGCAFLKEVLQSVARSDEVTGGERMLAAVAYAIMQDIATSDQDAVQRGWRAIRSGLQAMSSAQD